MKVFRGTGSFVDKHSIKVESQGKEPTLITGDIILIATGSKPRRPENFPKDNRIYDSDTILQIKEIPKKMVIIGGGVIGCEYACTFATLGVEVSLIYSQEILLPFVDRDISSTLERCMSKIGIKLLFSEKVRICTVKEKTIELLLDSGNICQTDTVMFATGRISNTEELHLDAAGITPGKYGLLSVNKYYQVIHPKTKKIVPGIFAAGDVIGRPALASTAMEQARYAMIKAFDLEPYKKHVAPILPTGIYTIPECSLAGKTEKECIDENIDYVIGKAFYNSNTRGMIIGDTDGFLKLIFEYNNNIHEPMKLLGVQIIGEIASELIHFGISALIMNAKSDLIIDTCFNYPTLSELYKYATYDAMGHRIKRVCADQKNT